MFCLGAERTGEERPGLRLSPALFNSELVLRIQNKSTVSDYREEQFLLIIFGGPKPDANAMRSRDVSGEGSSIGTTYGTGLSRFSMKQSSSRKVRRPIFHL